MPKRKPASATAQAPNASARKRTAGRDAGRPLWRAGRWAVLVLLLTAAGAGLFATMRRARPPVRAAAPAAVAPALPPVEQALRSALATRPNEPAPHEALARYLLVEHRPFEALWQFRALQDLQPDDPNVPLALAGALTAAGLPGAALQRLTATAGASPESGAKPDTHRGRRRAEIAVALAETALATARPAQALRFLSEIGPGLSTSVPGQLFLGDARAASGDRAGAQAAYRRTMALQPAAAVAADRLGRLALAAGDWAAARSWLTAARAAAPRSPGPLYRLGLAAAGAGQTAEAERLWQAAAALAPRYAPAQAALGRLYGRRKQWNLAEPHLVAAVQSDPGSEAQLDLADVKRARGDLASALYQRGFYDLETDRPHEALQEFQRLVAAAPARPDGPLMISLADIQMKRLDLAVAAAQRGLDQHADDSGLLARLAQLHTISHNWPRVRQLCEEWLRRDPHAAEPHTLLERIAREEQRLPEALRDGEQSLALNPQSGAACYQMSLTLSAVPSPANQRRALDLARRATVLSPREADYWHQLGVLLCGAGQLEEAAGAFLHALDLDPAALQSARLLAQVAAQERRPASARFFADMAAALDTRARTGDALWQAVGRRPDDAPAHARLARYLLAYGDLRRARYQLQQVLAVRPTDAAARRDLAVVERIRALEEE